MSRQLNTYLILVLFCIAAQSSLAVEILNDPMRPLVITKSGVKKESVGAGYRLSSIFISPTRRAAIINGRTVTVGEQVNNARVMDIRATEVTISLAGKTRTLTLLPVSIKKPAEASR